MKNNTRDIICIGDTIYVSESCNLELHKGSLRHEIVHAKDYMAGRLSYLLTYMLSKKWRSYWERRAFTQNMMVEFEDTGDISTHTLSGVIAAFDNEDFLKIIQIKERIISKDYQGAYPDVN